MANIQPEIKKIQTATYGEEVRNSFISALEKINSSTGSASIDDIRNFVNEYLDSHPQDLTLRIYAHETHSSGYDADTNPVDTYSDGGVHIDGALDPSTIYIIKNSGGAHIGILLCAHTNGYNRAAQIALYADGRFKYRYRHNSDGVWDNWESLLPFDAVVRNYKDATPDVTFNMHNTKVDAFLQTEAYDSSNYSYSNLPTADSTNWDRPNTTTITIPSGSSKIVFYDTVTKAERVESTSGTTHTVDNLIPNRNYAYTVRNSSGEMLMHGIIKATGQLRMINAGGDDTEVDRTFNIRDLGGWTATGGKLKYGLVYRGGELNGSISISSAQQAFFKDVLGIRHEIDLRDNGEPGVGATALGCGVNYYHLATGRSPYILWDNDTYAKKRADVIKQLAKNIKNGEPTYIHCQAGADRTGVMCVFLKAICGVSQSDIDRDQELSYYSYQADPQRVRKRNNAWANGHRVMINGTGAEDYSQPYINNMEGSSFQDKIVRLLLRSGVTIDELNDIRFGLIDGNPTALTNPYGNATITKTLSHVFIDNEDTSVKLYQPFEARVLPNDGYILTSVSVTMGGTDITSTAYNAERILIPRVTGDIIIIASATDVVIPDVSGKENASNKVQSIGSQSQTGDNDKYPSVTAVRDYVNTKTEEFTGYTKAEADGIISQMISRAAAAKIKSYDTVAEMKSDTALSAGKLVRTVGYYSPNDGGGAFYKIVSSTSAYAETINNNLYAELIVDGGCKNARCYGAKGDNVTDDTSALQVWLNDVAINGGYAYLPRGRYKITAPLTVDWGHHGGNPRNFLQRLIGDGCTSYESNYDNTCIIASNIGEKRGAIEFVGDGNTWGTQVEISNIGIYCDSTCHAMSFCLFYGDSRQLILRKVKMRGNNNLYVRCGSKNGGTSSYEHLCVSIEHCDLLIRGSQTKGFSLLPESIGIENGQAFSMFDNLAVHNTVIGGLLVAHVNNLTVNDCVVSIDNIKNKVKTTSNCGRLNGYEIDYATGILIVETASTIIRNLYCEDYRRAIDISPICGNIRSVIVEGSYFNPGCNQYDDNNNLIKSDYGIFIRDGGADFKVAHVEIVHNVFRHDGTNVEFANAAVYNGAAKEIIIRSNAGRPALNADQIVNNAGEVVSIDAVFTTAYKSKLDNVDTVPTENSDNLITSGAVYTAVSGKADSADIPTKTSDLTNDSGFLTAHQDISGKADVNHTHSQYLTSHQDITGKENTSNKVTSVSSSSTNAQYPSALAVYNAIQTAIGGVENGSY